MSIIGNILWIISGGFLIFLEYALGGVAMCATIVGIPFGIQLFKLALLGLLPFGKTIVSTPTSTGFLARLQHCLDLYRGHSCLLDPPAAGIALGRYCCRDSFCQAAFQAGFAGLYSLWKSRFVKEDVAGSGTRCAGIKKGLTWFFQAAPFCICV